MKRYGARGRGVYEDRERDLQDVNEQELSKEGSALYFSPTGEDDTVMDERRKENGVTSSDAVAMQSVNIRDDTEAEKKEKTEAVADACAPSLPTVRERETDILPSTQECNEDGDGEPLREPPKEERRPEGKQRHESRKRKRGGGAYVAVMVFCLLSSLAILALATKRGQVGNAPAVDPSPQAVTQAPTDTQSAPDHTRGVYAAGAASAVTVTAMRADGVTCATGFFVFEDGYIATLAETVSGAEKITVTLADGTSLEAETVGAHAVSNLALLKAPVSAPLLSVGDSSSVKAGDRVFSVGTIVSERLSSSLWSGSVSYALRSLELELGEDSTVKLEAIQISPLGDTAMRGAPILNESAEVIAIALIADGKAADFGLPMDKALGVLEALKNGEEPSAEVVGSLAHTLPRLGILGESREEEGVRGVYVASFSSDSCAAAKILRRGDLIVSVGDSAVTDTETLKNALCDYRSGDEAEIYVLRSGQRLSFFVKLE